MIVALIGYISYEPTNVQSNLARLATPTVAVISWSGRIVDGRRDLAPRGLKFLFVESGPIFQAQQSARVCQTWFDRHMDKPVVMNRPQKTIKAGGRPLSYDPKLVHENISDGLAAGMPADDLDANYIKKKLCN